MSITHPYAVHVLVRENISGAWGDWFAPLYLSHPDTGGTLLNGTLPDQTALHGLLAKLRDLNLTILAMSLRQIPSADDRTAAR